MVYDVFLNRIHKTLQETLGDGYAISIQPVPKNNGKILDGISIQAPGAHMAPTIYLNAYYEQYTLGMDFNDIVTDILNLFYLNPAPAHISAELISSLDQIRDKIMFKLIHAESNEALLSQLPHIPLMDLAIVFYLFLDHNETGQMTATIYREHLDLWGIGMKELEQMAFENTPRAFPPQIKTMKEVMSEMARSSLGEDFSDDILDALFNPQDIPFPLYVLSNETGINGAGCMIYPDTLKNFAEFLDSDLIVLPSSIHEVLLTPDHPEASYEELSELVTNINQSEVPAEDRLSNQIYTYQRRSGQLAMATHSRGLTEDPNS